jgi:hypothetical protein
MTCLCIGLGIIFMCIGLPLYMIGYDPGVGGGSLLFKAQNAHVVYNNCKLKTVSNTRGGKDKHKCDCTKKVIYTYNHTLNKTCSIYTRYDGNCVGKVNANWINTTYSMLPVRTIFIGTQDGECYSGQAASIPSCFGFAFLFIAGICVIIAVYCKTKSVIRLLLSRPPEPKTTHRITPYVKLEPIHM